MPAAPSRRAFADPSATAGLGLIGGFAAARVSGRRGLGGLVFAVAGAWSAREWARTSGPGVAAGLSAGYVVAMGASHPLARRLGAWPSVLAVTAAVVTASRVATGR